MSSPHALTHAALASEVAHAATRAHVRVSP